MTRIKSGTAIRRRFSLAIVGSLVGGAALLLGTLRAEASTMPTYSESRISSEYTGGGTAQGWKDHDQAWSLPLPFSFPFYDRTYNTAYVSSNGYVTFDGPSSDMAPDLPSTKGVYPYATDLYSRHAGGLAQDIRTSSSASEVRVTWNTETFAQGGTTSYAYSQPVFRGGYGFTDGPWQGDDAYWALDLPFTFPFYGERFSRVYVGSNGYLTFGSGATIYSPSLDSMKGVFAFGRDLRTDCSGDGIWYGYDEQFQIETIEWYAHTYNANCALAQAVRFSVELKPSGSIRVVYYNIQDPTTGHVAGISKGDGVNKVVSSKDHAPVASSALDDLYTPNGGYPVNVEVVLKPTGEIRMRYGDMQDPSSATVGVSRGDNVNYQTISGYNGTTIPSNAQTVVLTRQPSTDPPVISGYQVSPAVFSPNGDGQNESAVFSGSWNRYGTWSLGIKDGSGSTVRTYSGSGGTSLSQAWEGKNTSGVVVPDGSYTATLTVTDIDGLAATATTTVYADVAGPTISGLAASPTPFSPNADGTKDSTTISATLADPSPPITWALAIKNGAGTSIRSYSGSGANVAQTWDGKDSGGTTVVTGDYTAALTSYDSAGNQRTATTTASVDLTAPTISGFAASQAPFSPNGDGTKDSTTFTATTSDASTPVSWSLAIKNSSNTTVRTYTGSGSSISQVWDGKNESGTVVPDGAYNAYLTATDTQNLSRTSGPVTISVDNTAPSISGYAVSPNPFSPNADGVKDITYFSASLSSDLSWPVTWRLDVKNSAGTDLRTYTGLGNDNWVEQVWDGTNGSGVLQLDGTYTGLLTATDGVGNSSNATQSVVLDTTGPAIASYTAAPTPFSPNADGTKDSTTFSATLSDPSTPATWILTLRNSADTVVRTFSGSGTSVSRVWDGKDASNVVVPDGAYTGTLAATDAAGNPSSGAVTVIADRTAPAISGFAASQTPFSPNADGTKDSTTLSASIADASTPVAWSLAIKNGSNTVVRTYTGSGTSISQVWDGKNDSGTVVPDGFYNAYLTATDTQNLSTTAAPVAITVDTTAPVISSYVVSPNPFSPNADGTKDTTTFAATISEANSWTLDVKNGAGTIKRSYSGSTTSVSQSWDGKDSSGVLLPDAADYTGALKATDAAGNQTTSISTPVTLDTAVPVISGLVAVPTPFSPNADGTKDSTTINAALSESGSWSLDFRNASGSIVRTYSGNGSSVSQGWDGKNGSGTVQPEGAYTPELTVTDAAGNRSTGSTTATIDLSAPYMQGLEASPDPFSPNADGIKDTTTITASLSDASTPVAWSLVIKDDSGTTTLRTYSGSGTSVAQVWDGKDDTGTTVPDGLYRATLTATDTQNLSSSRDLVNLRVDTVSPVISGLSASPNPFSPNGDGVKDSATFTATLSDPSAPVVWDLAIKNGSGTTVRTYASSGTSVWKPWDGKNGSGVVQPDGTYTGALTATDQAGNSATSSISVVVDTTAPAISAYSASPTPFSPNADGTKDSATFGAALSDPSTPLNWTLTLRNSADTVVRSFSGSGTSVSQAWDGRDSSNAIVPDGAYTGTLSGTDAAGNSSSSPATVVVDRTAPSITGFAASQSPFSPNADGTKDSTTLSASIADASTPVAWSLAIKNGADAVVRAYSGSGSSVSQAWDGEDGTGLVVPDGAYTATLAATDTQNLSSTSDPVTITVDTVAPAISGYSASPTPFSPNGDLVKDSTTFNGSISDSSAPVTWTLRVRNSAETQVRWWNGSGTSVEQGWDGKRQPEDPWDTNPPVVDDDTYTATITAVDPAGNSASSATGVVVDTQGPVVRDYAASNNPFSPNGDGTKDTTTLTATFTEASTPVGWTLDIKNAASVTLRSYSGTGSSLSQSWDGKNTAGLYVSDGTYSAVLSATDDANNATTLSAAVTVDDAAPLISGFAVSPDPFSPNADGTKDAATFAASISDASPPVTWTLAVKNPLGLTVRSWSGSGSTVSQLWDGKDSLGSIVADDTYTATLTATDSQNLSGSSSTSVEIDTVAPTLSGTGFLPVAFSPNADSVKDTSTFAADASEQVTWSLAIKNSSGDTVRSFTGSGAPVSQAWNGKDVAAASMADGIYTARLSAADLAGNSSSSSASVIIDTVAPAINAYAASPTPFSPNADETKDTTALSASLTDPTTPLGWALTIKDATDTTTRAYSGAGALVSQAWDGRNTSGSVVPDASYTATLAASDDAGNIGVASVSVRVDTRAPVIAGLAASPTSFSPNGDGTLETTTASASISDDSGVDWTLAVKNDAGDTVRSFSGTNTAVSQDWDGKDDQGALAPNATYTLVLTATDAQSLVATASASVILDTAAPLITSYAASPNPFSPNNDSKVETTTFSGTISKPATWTMSIRDSGGTTRRTFSGSGTTLSQDWDGKNASGTVLGDGTYTAGLTLTDALGNTTSAPSTTVVIDKTPPTISDLTATNLAFSPNGDGSKDTTKFQANLSDASAPISWTATVKNAQGATVVTISGTCDLGTSSCGIWDGKDSSGVVVADGVYSTALSAKDPAENVRPPVPGQSITVDTVLPGADRLAPEDHGNSVWGSGQIVAAHVFDNLAGINSTAFTLSVDGLSLSASSISYNPATKWVKSTPQVFATPSSHIAEMQVADRAGNVLIQDWGFRVIAVPSITPGSALLSGAGTDTGNSGTGPLTHQWTFIPSLKVGNGLAMFAGGSAHAGWGMVKNKVSLDTAAIAVTTNGVTQDWPLRPYPAGTQATVYQQVAYADVSGGAQTAVISSSGGVLPQIQVDLPVGTSAARLHMNNGSQVSAAFGGVCADPTSAPGVFTCSPDPLRFYLTDLAAASIVEALGRADPSSSIVEIALAEYDPATILTYLAKVKLNDPAAYEDLTWRTFLPVNGLICNGLCFLEGLAYRPYGGSGALIVGDSQYDEVCAHDPFCRYPAVTAEPSRQSRCVNAQNGTDKFEYSNDVAENEKGCAQNFGWVNAVGGESHRKLALYSMFWSDWGFEDGKHDELGFVLGEQDGDPRTRWTTTEPPTGTYWGVLYPRGADPSTCLPPGFTPPVDYGGDFNVHFEDYWPYGVGSGDDSTSGTSAHGWPQWWGCRYGLEGYRTTNAEVWGYVKLTSTPPSSPLWANITYTYTHNIYRPSWTYLFMSLAKTAAMSFCTDSLACPLLDAVWDDALGDWREATPERQERHNLQWVKAFEY